MRSAAVPITWEDGRRLPANSKGSGSATMPVVVAAAARLSLRLLLVIAREKERSERGGGGVCEVAGGGLGAERVKVGARGGPPI